MTDDFPWEAFSLLVLYDCDDSYIESIELQAHSSDRLLAQVIIRVSWPGQLRTSDEFVSSWVHIVRY